MRCRGKGLPLLLSQQQKTLPLVLLLLDLLTAHEVTDVTVLMKMGVEMEVEAVILTTLLLQLLLPLSTPAQGLRALYLLLHLALALTLALLAWKVQAAMKALVILSLRLLDQLRPVP